MPEEIDLQTHSEEVQDIMSHIPNSVIRWGLTVIFLVFALLVIGSYFFRVP